MGDGGAAAFTEYKYDPDGNRVHKSVNNEADDNFEYDYLIDRYNHTGYAQVFEETEVTYPAAGGDPTVKQTCYIIGDDVLAQAKGGDADSLQYLLYDGHGPTRQLVDSTGATINEQYSFDAYGVMLGGNPGTESNPGSPATNLLYSGEQWDNSAQSYYLRARYYDPLNGRLNRMDPYAGSPQDPQTLHKYTYCHNNPVNNIDPTGEFSLPEILTVKSIAAVAIASVAPAIITAYETAKGGASILEILKNASITYFISFGLGLALVAAAPYIMAAIVTALSLVPGVSAGTAAAAIAIVFIGLTMYGAYELWSSAYPLWLKISVTAILAVSVVVGLGRDGIKQLASKAKDIIKGVKGKPPARRVTNPWGRRGSPPHRNRILEAEQRFNDKHWTTVSGGSKPEARVYMPDGSYRYPDLVLEKGGTRIAINVGHATKGGLPVSGERPALADLRKAGELAHAFFISF